MDLYAKDLFGYRLLDSGGERKLEQFGEVVLDRPCPQAIWPQAAPGSWASARARFDRGEGGSGEWSSGQGGPVDRWRIRLSDREMELRLTGFGNIGLFPEHTVHWQWMHDLLGGRPGARVLNLFAYTGGGSLLCAEAGARVTHVDAARSVNGWAQVNAKLCRTAGDGIRFITDDAVKFVKREQRRQSRYDGIIIDPPTFGRGPKGEVWKIERDLYPLLAVCCQVLVDRPLFVLLTSHSPGVTPSVLRTMPVPLGSVSSGEMLLSGDGPSIPAGVYARWA